MKLRELLETLIQAGAITVEKEKIEEILARMGLKLDDVIAPLYEPF